MDPTAPAQPSATPAFDQTASGPNDQRQQAADSSANDPLTTDTITFAPVQSTPSDSEATDSSSSDLALLDQLANPVQVNPRSDNVAPSDKIPEITTDPDQIPTPTKGDKNNATKDIIGYQSKSLLSQQSTTMPSPINPDHFYSIGEAAQLLHVSIDTLRRWEQKGTIQAQRTAGKLRRFKGQELLDYLKEEQNQDTLMPISDVAKKLGISIQTLRRWDKSGRLRAERAADGARMYPAKQVKEIIEKGIPQESHEQSSPLIHPNSTISQTSSVADGPKPQPPRDFPAKSADNRLIEKTEVLSTKALDILRLQVSKRDVAKTPAEKDGNGLIVRPAVEDHGTNSAGTATLPKGSNKVVIKTTAFSKGSQVYLTAITPINEQLCVPIAIDKEGFAVVTAQIVPLDVLFNWIVIAVLKG